MYRISKDIRAQRSAQRIGKALLDCARQKPFAKISVSDLHRDYQISRTTFYRLFDNTVDVLEYMTECMAREILLNLRGDTLKEQVIYAMIELEKRRDLIEVLSENSRLDIFQKKGEKYIPQSQLMAGLDADGKDEYFHRILSHLIPLVIDLWLSNGRTDPPEEIYRKLRRSIRLLHEWFSQ